VILEIQVLEVKQVKQGQLGQLVLKAILVFKDHKAFREM
jgi:hypothetical protein